MVFSLFAIYTCNLVAAYIIPSVFFHFLKILHGEANLRYTTILCYTCDLVAAYIIPSVFFCNSGETILGTQRYLKRSIKKKL